MILEKRFALMTFSAQRKPLASFELAAGDVCRQRALRKDTFSDGEVTSPSALLRHRNIPALRLAARDGPSLG